MAIWTPDQRLRVFVSSTLNELARERRAIARAVTGLGLSPVRFESGARPHPPRELYQAYLAQSDVFIGLYWQRYGWVAPDMAVSGLEDEYLSSRSLPRLLYVKMPAPDRDRRLAALLSRIEEEGAECYRSFRTPAELGRLVHDDLALLLSERFGKSGVRARDRGAGGLGRGELTRLPVALPLRAPVLVGREDLLVSVHRLLSGGRTPEIVILCGLGGVGKTSLAAEYAHRHLASVGIAWQVPAQDPAAAEASLAELAAQAGGPGAVDRRDPVASAHAVLAAYPADWLLIFDNAAGETAVSRFIPPTGRGRVLITSQNQHWPGFRVEAVPLLDRYVAAGFLASQTHEADLGAAAELARELGDLPLALAQAAAYIQATGTSVAGYLALLRKRPAELLARGQASGHPAGVAATIGLALAQLGGNSQATGLLRLLACLAPEPVPLALILSDGQSVAGLDADVAAVVRPLLGDEIAVADAVAALRRFSLLAPTPGGMVQVHRLVQAITLDDLPAEQAAVWRQFAAKLIESAIPADTTMPATWPSCALLLAHAQASLTLISPGMSRMAIYVGRSGSYPAAREMFRQIAAAREQAAGYGPDHPDTLAAYLWLARFTAEAGDSAAARDQLAALLPAMIRVLGHEHPDTLDARSELATLTGWAGDVARARDLFTELLAVEERVLGPEHPHTLDVRHELATFTGRAGDPARARDLFAELLPIRRRTLGPKHPVSLVTRHQLATYTGDSGDPASARDLFAALVPDEEQVLGPQHPHTLTARHQLATFTGEAGDTVQARNLLSALLPVEERVLGPEHPETLGTSHQLARFTGETGDAASARDQLAVVLPVRERVAGHDHPSTLAARHQLARFTGEAGDPSRARDMFAALIPVSEDVLGSEHPDSLSARHQFARWSGEVGDSARAKDILAALVPVCERVLGPQHPHTLATINSLEYWTSRARPASESDIAGG